MHIDMNNLRHIIRETLTEQDTENDVEILVWRGINDVSTKTLAKMIKTTPKNMGVVNVNINSVVNKAKGWWSNRMGFAMAYASTDNDDGPRHVDAHDVVFVGSVIVPRKYMSREVTHYLRDVRATVHIEKIYYARRQGTSAERKARLESLIT